MTSVRRNLHEKDEARNLRLRTRVLRQSAHFKMPEPALLRVKRKATEDAPDILVLEERHKRAATNIHYVREPNQDAPDVKSGEITLKSPKEIDRADQSEEPAKRLFHLNSKRKGPDESVATFVEKRVKSYHDHANKEVEDMYRFEHTQTPAKPLKRPGKGAALNTTLRVAQDVQTDVDRRRMEERAAYMNLAAIEEIKRERVLAEDAKRATPSKQVATPKLSGQRSRDLHHQRVATNNHLNLSKDAELEEDSDYVYDTYILAPSSATGAAESADLQSRVGNVGYLVITEEDESLWETYLGDEPSDKDWDSDDEDENAEDYYGADYPEDELASDDEFDRGAYGFRGGGASDEEEWDADTGLYSDGEDGADGLRAPFSYKTMSGRFDGVL